MELTGVKGVDNISTALACGTVMIIYVKVSGKVP